MGENKSEIKFIGGPETRNVLPENLTEEELGIITADSWLPYPPGGEKAKSLVDSLIQKGYFVKNEVGPPTHSIYYALNPEFDYLLEINRRRKQEETDLLHRLTLQFPPDGDGFTMADIDQLQVSVFARLVKRGLVQNELTKKPVPLKGGGERKVDKWVFKIPAKK